MCKSIICKWQLQQAVSKKNSEKHLFSTIFWWCLASEWLPVDNNMHPCTQPQQLSRLFISHFCWRFSLMGVWNVGKACPFIRRVLSYGLRNWNICHGARSQRPYSMYDATVQHVWCHRTITVVLLSATFIISSHYPMHQLLQLFPTRTALHAHYNGAVIEDFSLPVDLHTFTPHGYQTSKALGSDIL